MKPITFAIFTFICQVASATRQRSDLRSSLRVKLPSISISINHSKAEVISLSALPKIQANLPAIFTLSLFIAERQAGKLWIPTVFWSVSTRYRIQVYRLHGGRSNVLYYRQICVAAVRFLIWTILLGILSERNYNLHFEIDNVIWACCFDWITQRINKLDQNKEKKSTFVFIYFALFNMTIYAEP